MKFMKIICVNKKLNYYGNNFQTLYLSKYLLFVQCYAHPIFSDRKTTVDFELFLPRCKKKSNNESKNNDDENKNHVNKKITAQKAELLSIKISVVNSI